MRSPRFLGLRIGTRKVGVAVVEKYSIYYCQVKSFKHSWSSKKLQVILASLEQYATKYNVSRIALKIPPPYSHSTALKQLVRAIHTWTRVKQLPCHTYNLLSLKAVWKAGTQKQNKSQLMEAILDRYNLNHVYKKEQRNKRSHYEKIFEAVGVAEIVLRQERV